MPRRGPGRRAGRPRASRTRTSVEDTSRRGIDTRSTRHPSPGGTACSPSRSITTIVARSRVSSRRRQVAMFATASAPRSRNNSRPGRASASSVSAVTDAPSRSTSIALASTPSTSATAASTSARRSARRRDDLTPLLPRVARDDEEHAVQLERGTGIRCRDDVPDVDGSNVPPSTPTRSDGGSASDRALSAIGMTLRRP